MPLFSIFMAVECEGFIELGGHGAVLGLGLHDKGEIPLALVRDDVLPEVGLGVAAHHAGAGFEDGEEHIVVGVGLGHQLDIVATAVKDALEGPLVLYHKPAVKRRGLFGLGGHGHGLEGGPFVERGVGGPPPVVLQLAL